MTADNPIACSLSADDLRRRLDAIAALGAEGLIWSEAKGGRHLLRFRAGAETRQQLEEIVAAEAECCSFLDFTLEDQGGAILLAIAAPPEAQSTADELAAAFAGASA